jgi:hypothetical protein
MPNFNISGGWTLGQGWTLQSYSGNAITTGLVMNLDAGNTASYPGTGTTWTDISSNHFSGTMNSGVTYSSANGGSMVFDGTIYAYINVTGATTVTSLTNNFSIEAWYKSTNNAPKILATGSGSSGIDFGQYSSQATKWKVTKYGVVDIYTGSVPQDTNWHQVVVTYSSTTGTILYIDGAVSGTSAGDTSNAKAGTANIPVGQAEGGYHTGSISIVRWYSAVLSASDVLQNFNANRNRYGI